MTVGMPKFHKGPLLVVIPLGALLSLLRTDLWLVCMVGFGVVSLLGAVAMRLLKRYSPAPVPDSAVRQLLESLASDAEWISIRFAPGVSLHVAAVRVGHAITESERLMSFNTKLAFTAQAMPHVAIFYSGDKGFVAARRLVIEEMVRRYGRWTLDTWFALVGALRKNGYGVHSLDGAQFVATSALFRR